MSKNKTPKAPKAPKAVTPKAERKPRKAWGSKQLERIARLDKMNDKLVALAAKANPPNAIQLLDRLSEIEVALVGAHEYLTKLGEWKAAAKGKAAIGATIKVKAEALGAATFTVIPADIFTGAVVTNDDGQDWIVRCTDGVARVLKKKYAALNA
jgi:ribosomal protein L7Ae-like RNA K-turn-binding protein